MNSSGHKLAKAWHSRNVNLAMWAAAIVWMMVPGRASAQNYGGGGGTGFAGLGGDLLDIVCSFTQSPIVTVIVAMGLIACFVVAALNEDKGTLSTVLKVVGFGLALVMLPRLMNAVGFNWGCVA